MLKKASFMSRLPMQETTDFSLWRNAILSIQKTNKPRTLVCGKPKVFLILTISLFALIFFSINLVSAIGVSYPIPQNIQLKPSQSSYFTFQIQTDEYPVTCVPLVEETSGLELAFNQQYLVEANQRYNVKAQVIVPKQTAFGEYQATFCMECTPSGETEGSRIIPRVCKLPITVDVVSDRSRENRFEQEAANYVIVWITLLVLSILVLVLIIFYLIRRRRARTWL